MKQKGNENSQKQKCTITFYGFTFTLKKLVPFNGTGLKKNQKAKKK